jgi:pilus assembly protein CpaE
VMIVMDGDARTAISLMEEINRSLPTTQIFGLSRHDTTENIIKAMRGGATEFLSLPLDPAQVLKALIKASALQRLGQPVAASGQVWTVYSPKGGAGTTMTAANLAVELHEQHNKSVCLVDLDFQSGDLALALNLNPVYTIVDIVLNFRRLDSVFLQGTLTRHSSGVYLLAAPPPGSVDAAAIPADQIRSVLELLKSMYDVVIIDTARVVSEETVAALWNATRIILLLERSLPFMRGYRRSMEVLEAIGVPKERVDVVITKDTNSKAAVPLDEAKKSLDLTVTHTLPRDDETALAALNRGLFLTEVKKSSPLRKEISELARIIFESVEGAAAGTVSTSDPKKRKGILSSLFSS